MGCITKIGLYDFIQKLYKAWYWYRKGLKYIYSLYKYKV